MSQGYTVVCLALVIGNEPLKYLMFTDTQFIRNKVLPVADKFRDVRFALANEEEFDEEIKSLGLEDSGESVNVAAFSGKLKYVTMYSLSATDSEHRSTLERGRWLSP